KRSEIESQIESFTILLNDLRRQLAKVDEDIDSHRRLISGIHMLPLELLQKIFSFCLPSYNCAMSAAEAPLILTCICRKWREAALSAPQFWSRLHISMPSCTDENLRSKGVISRYGDAIKTWLDRASGLPLSISFVNGLSSQNPGLSDRLDSHILGIIASFARNWVHLNLKLKYEQLAHFSHLTESNVPLLETVQLEIPPPSLFRSIQGPGPAQKKHIPFFSAPSIKHLLLRGWSDVSSLPIRWGAMTRLSLLSWSNQLTGIELNVVENILRQCPNLVVCTLQIHNIFGVPPGMPSHPSKPLRLLCLEELRVYFHHGDTSSEEKITSFFGNLEVPEIRHLEVTAYAVTCCQVPFMPLLLRPHKIDTMSFLVHGSEDYLLECLRAVPLLRRLALITQTCHSMIPPAEAAAYSRLHESLLDYLTAPALSENLEPEPNSLTLCPFLEEIEFTFPLDLRISVEQIIRFLLSRTTLAPAEVAPLRRADFFIREICDSTRNAMSSHTGLGTALQAGLDLSMHYYPDTEATQVVESLPVFSAKRDIDISQPHYDWKPRPGFSAHVSRF
ncbi:hypothetical protein H0H81_003421, partial [Sphagnurus paluster]